MPLVMAEHLSAQQFSGREFVFNQYCFTGVRRQKKH